MQALYEAILEDETILTDAFKHEVHTRQAETSGDQELRAFFRQRRDENRRRAERAERPLAPSGCPGRRFYAGLRRIKEGRQGVPEAQEP
jgi:hypothetical protein